MHALRSMFQWLSPWTLNIRINSKWFFYTHSNPASIRNVACIQRERDAFISTSMWGILSTENGESISDKSSNRKCNSCWTCNNPLHTIFQSGKSEWITPSIKMKKKRKKKRNGKYANALTSTQRLCNDANDRLLLINNYFGLYSVSCEKICIWGV